jgi:PhzF family phenazine biosynthesis protein
MTQIFTVDCFTDRPFTGNPTAVCLLESGWPTNAWLQSLAAELGLPATAFVTQSHSGTELRWFSPRAELELCGSGTLAAAHILGQNGDRGDAVTFATRSGALVARYESNGRITLDFAADVPRHAVSPGLTTALGVRPVAVARGRFDLLAELDTADAVQALEPNLTVLATLDVRGIIVTAIGDADDEDFVSRFFAPAVGIDEDPVTGSAHSTLGPYWSAQLGKTALTGRQVSVRGGRVDVEVRGDRVDVSGRAVTVASGKLVIPGW